MTPFSTSNVSKKEWQWVVFWGGFFTILTMLPYALAMLIGDDQWIFSGLLSSPEQSANKLAQIRQGHEGQWLFELRYTPETSAPVLLNLFYIFLGQIARILGLSNIVIFHLARVGASLFMFMAFYHLGSSIWQRIRPRRLFFGLISVGSGLGWVLLLVSPESPAADLSFPSAFPLYAAYISPHLPLAIGALSLMASYFIRVFRPGYEDAPTVDNGGLTLILLSIVIIIVLPSVLIGIMTALAIFVLATAYIEKEFPWHEMRWSVMVWLPILPAMLYLTLLSDSSKIIEQFLEQVYTPAPNIILFVFGYGLLIIIAFPGLRRAARHFERDSDQLMFIWFFSNLIIIFIPSPLQGRLLAGFIIPMTFFVVRSLEDYWLEHISDVSHQRLFIGMLLVLIIPSNILALGIPLYGALFNREAGADQGILIHQDYDDTLQWLAVNGIEDEIVLASPHISIWIPVHTDLRVVYGHPFETVPAEELRDQVTAFFEGDDCQSLFDEDQNFTIDYVIWGEHEQEMVSSSESCLTFIHEQLEINEEAICTEDSQRIRCFGDVRLYVLRELR